ncbi:hypothetical protein [Corynebacterium sp. 22KM0430]|uniref:hypothetical protein n=1 Tax=Corynebacterium sp. 22KM0430 TaxID=2989735 RepID=UPI0029CA0F93|nr:hypothetical protein [Corynebacterium sp. 22KM0430]WPF66571.1 hypothetical protein OLX12_02240 [Corynebacterium sp. 22KM0430]
MPNLLRVSSGALIFLSFIVAFPLAHLFDDDLGSAGNHAFLITESSGQTSPTEFRDDLVLYAKNHKITVGLEHFETTAAGTTHHLYVAAGENSSIMATWLRTGYAGFDPTVNITVSPLSEAPITDAGGVYHLSGSSTNKEALQRHIEELGFTITDYKINWDYFLTDPITITIVAMLLLIATLTLGGVLLRARDYSIQRIHGHGFWGIIVKELRDLIPTALSSFLILGVISALALYLYNGLSMVRLYLQCCAALLLAAGLIFFLSLLIGVAILHLISLIPALSGKIPGAPVSLGTYALRLCALTVALTAVGATVSTALEMQLHKSQRDLWRAHGEAEAFNISTRTGDTDSDIAPALREADRRGEILLSVVSEDISFTPSVLLVNSLFAEQEVSLSANEAPQSGEALILIPEGTRAEYIDMAHQKILFEAEYAGIPTPTIREKIIAGDTEVFTYAPSFGFTLPKTTVSGIPIVVLPRGLETLADKNLVAPTTQLKVLATNREAMEKLIADPSVGPYIAGHFTAFSHWEQTYAKAQSVFRSQAINLAILILVVTAYVVGSAAVYQARHRQRLTVTDLMGRSPWRARAGLLLIEAVFLLIPAAWLWHRQSNYEAAALTAMPRDVLRTMAVTPELVAVTLGISLLWALTCLAMSARFGRIYSRTPAR